MAANTNPIFEKNTKVWSQTFASGDTSTIKDIVTGGAEGSRVDSVFITTDDTVAVNLAFYLHDGSTNYYIGVVAVPIGSGYTSVVRVEGLTTLSPLLGYLVVPNGYKLRANCVATMTSAKTTTVTAIGGDY